MVVGYICEFYLNNLVRNIFTETENDLFDIYFHQSNCSNRVVEQRNYMGSNVMLQQRVFIT